jgi:hypothetical protein
MATWGKSNDPICRKQHIDCYVFNAGDLRGCSDMTWTIARDAQLVRYFEHENVWSKEWMPVKDEVATILDHREQEVTLPIWEATFNGKLKRFAAKEVSNSVWVFALPEL